MRELLSQGKSVLEGLAFLAAGGSCENQSMTEFGWVEAIEVEERGAVTSDRLSLSCCCGSDCGVIWLRVAGVSESGDDGV